MNPSPPASIFAAAAAGRSRGSASSSSASARGRSRSRGRTSSPRRSPSPQPLTAVFPVYLPPVERTGMAASHLASPFPVSLVDRHFGFDVWVQLPGVMTSLILRFRRIRGKRGMELQGRVGMSASRIGGPAVRRPGARRLYSGGEFRMKFDFPVPVTRPGLIGYDRSCSTLLFTCLKLDEPLVAADYESDYETVRFGGNDFL